MTVQQAKEILLLYRPGRGDDADPEVAQALELAQRDPELQAWFQEHCAFNEALSKKFADLPVPRTLKGDILLGPRVVRGPAQWWSRRVALAAAACFVLFAVIGAMLWTSKPRNDFADFRARMVGSVLREYRMELFTNDMAEVRAYLARKGAPADYSVPSGLEATSLTGAGVLSWHAEPVAMVCFDRGKKDMVFMFVSRKGKMNNVTVSGPQLTSELELATASWTAGDKVYLLAASGTPEQLRTYLP